MASFMVLQKNKIYIFALEKSHIKYKLPAFSHIQMQSLIIHHHHHGNESIYINGLVKYWPLFTFLIYITCSLASTRPGAFNLLVERDSTKIPLQTGTRACVRALLLLHVLQ